MRTAPIAAFKARICEYLEKLPAGPVVITRHGRPAALVVTVPEDPEELESLLLSFSPRFWAIIDESRKGKRIPFDEFWRRAERRHGPLAKKRRKGV